MSINRHAPVGNTCGNIDRVIEAIREVIKSNNIINDLVRNEPNQNELDDIRYESDNIDNNLYSLEDMLEELRDANRALRDWGEELVSEYEELEKQLEY